MPLISVIIPTHNRPEWLAEALQSVKAQTLTDYEIIVVSNGETSEMRGRSQVASTMAGARWFAVDKGSVSAARNFGVAIASGEWIAFLDDDDIWLPNKLERQVSEAKRTGADMVACDYIFFFEKGATDNGPILRPRVPEGWSYTKAVNHHIWWSIPSVVLLSKRAFNAVGGFDERLSYIEDVDLWRRLSWRHTIYQMDEILLRYRSGHLNTTHPSNAHRRARWDLRHFAKMQRDTPDDLRGTLPSFWNFVLPRLPLAYGRLPKLLRQPFHPDRLRRRWKMITHGWRTVDDAF